MSFYSAPAIFLSLKISVWGGTGTVLYFPLVKAPSRSTNIEKPKHNKHEKHKQARLRKWSRLPTDA